jgi:hypothetical protein
LQRASDRVAARRNKMMPRGVRQPRLDRCREAADQRQAIYPEVDEPLRQRIDMPAGKPQELNRNRVVG